MKIIIPMAGMGSRLRPHTLTKPKALVSFSGKSILERLIEKLIKVVGSDLQDIVFITSGFGEEINEQIKNIASKFGVEGQICIQDKPLGTAHAIWCAREFINGESIVAFADTIFDTDEVIDKTSDVSLFVKRIDNPSAFGVVKMQGDEIKGFVEKPKEFVSDLAIIGIYYFKDEERLKHELNSLIETTTLKNEEEYQLTDVLESMLNAGLRFTSLKVQEWLDCGNYNVTVSSNKRVLELEGGKNDGVKLVNSIVIEPCYLGQGVEIINSVVGPYVSLEKGVEVFNSRIENSIVCKQTHLSQVVIKDSMIGENAHWNNDYQIVSIGDYCGLKNN